MKAVLMGMVAVATMGLTACQTTPQQTASAPVTSVPPAAETQSTAINIQPISSFMVEVSPRQAVCNSANPAQADCLQYRTRYQNNFNPLSKPIEGFKYQPGYAYLLDVKQEVVKNAVGGKLETSWVLNRVISRTSAASLAN
jgi:hypothetical protein